MNIYLSNIIIIIFTYVVISLPVVPNEDLPPEVVSSHGTEHNVGVVCLVVVADPGSDKSPETFHSWIGTESGDLLWLSLWN